MNLAEESRGGSGTAAFGSAVHFISRGTARLPYRVPLCMFTRSSERWARTIAQHKMVVSQLEFWQTATSFEHG